MFSFPSIDKVIVANAVAGWVEYGLWTFRVAAASAEYYIIIHFHGCTRLSET